MGRLRKKYNIFKDKDTKMFRLVLFTTSKTNPMPSTREWIDYSIYCHSDILNNNKNEL